MADKLQRYEEKYPEAVQDRPWVPPFVDIYENDNEVLLIADLPGVSKDHLVINVEKDQLMIEGRVDEPIQGSVIGREFQHADYRRTFLMPPGIDNHQIKADLKRGVLWLHLPKAEAVRPRQIQIKGG